MPPVSHGNTPLSMAPNLVRHPLKASVVRETRMRRWSTFTPPRHAANAARCGLFSLRRSYRLGITAEGDLFRPAVQSISEYPGARSARQHFDVQPVAVADQIARNARLERFDFCVCQSHVCVLRCVLRENCSKIWATEYTLEYTPKPRCP